MTEALTIDGAHTTLRSRTEPRAFVVLHFGDTSRIVDLPEAVEVTFGRSRGATVMLDHEKVSRLHTRLRRAGTIVEVSDLGSRNGTWVNGTRIEGVVRLRPGDEVGIGPATAVFGFTSVLRTERGIADAATGEARLLAEIDRAVRYRRAVTIALVRATDAAATTLAGSVRPMDLVAEDVGDDYLVILPELGREEGTSVVERWRTSGAIDAAAVVVCPDDGTRLDSLLHRLRTERRRGTAPAPSPPDRLVLDDGVVVEDPAMKRVYALADRVADSAMTVLVLGETGVGKELVAERLHHHSGRREGPLVKLNCAALPETLLESELFGFERGAFTGADRKKLGFFEAAHGGTLFLDELGELPLALQPKLLRVLERKVITRVGGTTEIVVDVRLVAATHRDLDAEVRAGRFRQDLLYRVAGFTIAIPPLRDRPSEILPLAERFIAASAAEQGRSMPALDATAREVLLAYAWPGNVRELKHAIEHALVMCGVTITAIDLPEKIREGSSQSLASTGSGVRGQIAELERATILAALEADGGNQTRAARRLGVSRRSLIYKMEKYGLKPPPGRSDS